MTERQREREQLVQRHCDDCGTALFGKQARADRPNATWEKVFSAKIAPGGGRLCVWESLCTECAEKI
jgi:hypothetical protein